LEGKKLFKFNDKPLSKNVARIKNKTLVKYDHPKFAYTPARVLIEPNTRTIDIFGEDVFALCDPCFDMLGLKYSIEEYYKS
jgi:hypothetical protein